MNKFAERLAAFVLCMGFLLGIHNGKVALWKDEDPHPVQIFDIPVSTLPPADQLLLRRGLPLENREALWRILENYLG